MFVKICGITSAAGLEAAIEAGADAVGFVFAESRREVSAEQAARIVAEAGAAILRVAVMRHPSAAHFAAVMETFRPDWVQTDAEDLEALAVDARIEALPVFRSGGTLPAAGLPARLLYESAASGSGRTADWGEAAALAERTEVVLAGGLSADNVERAVAAVRPWGVDVSTGVEREPGIKDPGKIKAFVAKVRAMEEP